MTAYSAGLVEELESEAHRDLLLFGEAVVRRIQRMLVAEGHCEPGSPLLDEAFCEVNADGSITVGLGSDVAVFLEFGTAPHVIEPRSPGGVLTNGIEFFGSHVDHPGTPAYYTVRRAVLAELAEWDRR